MQSNSLIVERTGFLFQAPLKQTARVEDVILMHPNKVASEGVLEVVDFVKSSKHLHFLQANHT